MNKKTSNYKPSVLICSKIKGNEIKIVQSKIKKILKEGGSHNSQVFSGALWSWQYENLPSKEANIYVIKSNDDIIGYYHVPIYYGQLHGKKHKFGMVQDVATSKTVRGQGVFKLLAEYATKDLVSSDIGLIYTFPNDKSIHAFLKYNDYRHVLSFDTYIFPVNAKLVIDSKIKIPVVNRLLGNFMDAISYLISPKIDCVGEIVIDKNSISMEVSQLFEEFSKSFNCSLIRDHEYLNWRFFQKPNSKHFSISYRINQKAVASAIFKVDHILGVDALVMLDFAFLQNNQNCLAKIISYVAKNAEEIFKKDIALIFTSFANQKFLKKRKYGFIRVPKKINPRVLNLLVNNVNSNSDVFIKDNWHATLSDWDVL